MIARAGNVMAGQTERRRPAWVGAAAAALLIGLAPVPPAASQVPVPPDPPVPIDAEVLPERPGRAGAPVLEDTAALAGFLDGVMEAQRAQLKIPAAVIAVVQGERVLFARGYGHADLERGTPVDPAISLFRVGSTSKLFTWTAVMQLVERGVLDLDTDVNEYLADIQIASAFDRPITLRHLLTHTPGFEDGFVGYLITEDTTAILPIEEAMRRHQPARVRPPGLVSSYSNYGTALAGLIVEQASGEPFDEYIERHIFEPLGMRAATFREPLPPDLAPHAVVGYAREGGVFVPKPFEIVGGFRPAGSASVAALDMARFMIAHLHEGRYGGASILSPETSRSMHGTAFRHDPRLPGMALGFYEQEINGLRTIGHGGDTFRFHTDMVLVPERQVGLFVSYVGDGGVPAREALVRAFFDRYFPDDSPLLAPLPPHPDAESNGFAAYTGQYRFTRRSHTRIDKFLSFAMPGIGISALPGDRVLVSGLGQEPIQFASSGEHLFREVGGHRRLGFSMDENGAATRVFFDFLPFMATERVPWYELRSLWLWVLGLSLVLFLSVLTGAAYRRGEIRAMPPPQKRAIWLSIATAVWLLATLVVAATVVGVYGASLFSHIPFALRAVLVMPIIFVLLAIAHAVAAVQAWRGDYWARRRRIHYTLVTLAALGVSLFFFQWNLLGWQFG